MPQLGLCWIPSGSWSRHVSRGRGEATAGWPVLIPRSQFRAMIGLGSQEQILHQLHSAGTGCSSSAHCSVQAEGISAAKNPVKNRKLLIFSFLFLWNCLYFTFSHLIRIKGYIWLHIFINSIQTEAMGSPENGKVYCSVSSHSAALKSNLSLLEQSSDCTGVNSAQWLLFTSKGFSH